MAAACAPEQQQQQPFAASPSDFFPPDGASEVFEEAQGFDEAAGDGSELGSRRRSRSAASSSAPRSLAGDRASEGSMSPTSPSLGGGVGFGRLRKKKVSRKKPWDESWSLLGNDHRYPAPLRRYFDELPAETAPPKYVTSNRMFDQMASSQASFGMNGSAGFAGSGGLDFFVEDRPQWNEQWGSLASRDNDGLHPHLRHYFDRRGFEASFRTKPHVDSPWLQQMPPRSPRRPDVRELLSKFSASAPDLLASTGGGSGGSSPQRRGGGGGGGGVDAQGRGGGDICWKERVLIYGSEVRVKDKQQKQSIPWVSDHHLGSTLDESSFAAMSASPTSKASPSSPSASPKGRGSPSRSKGAGRFGISDKASNGGRSSSSAARLARGSQGDMSPLGSASGCSSRAGSSRLGC